MKKKRFYYQNAPTQRENLEIADEIYRRCFDEPFPKDWNIYFGFTGHTDFDCKTITIASPDAEDVIRTMVHEFVHQRNPDIRPIHGQEFERLERKYLDKILHDTPPCKHKKKR